MEVAFLRHLVREARRALARERLRFDLERRVPGSRIERPFWIDRPEAFHAGPDLYVGRGCMIHCGGGPHFGEQGEVRLGRGCWLEHRTLIWGMGGVTFGDFTGTGPDTKILSFADDYGLEFLGRDAFGLAHQMAPVRIGTHVKLYSGVIVGPGVTVGDGAVVGAGSVVTRDIPPWTIAAGAPARPVRDRGAMALRNCVRRAS